MDPDVKKDRREMDADEKKDKREMDPEKLVQECKEKGKYWEEDSEDDDSIIEKISKSAQYCIFWLKNKNIGSQFAASRKRDLLYSTLQYVYQHPKSTLLLCNTIEKIIELIDKIPVESRCMGRFRLAIFVFKKVPRNQKNKELEEIESLLKNIKYDFPTLLYIPTLMDRNIDPFYSRLISKKTWLWICTSSAIQSQSKSNNISRFHRFLTGSTMLWVSRENLSNRSKIQLIENTGAFVLQINDPKDLEGTLRRQDHLIKNHQLRIGIDKGYDSYLEAVNVARQLSLCPIAIFTDDSTKINTSVYNYLRVAVLPYSDFEITSYASMKRIDWAPDISQGTIRFTRGFLQILEISCSNLKPKDTNGQSDPYVVLKVDTITKKFETKKIMKTLNPSWNLDLKDWTFPCEGNTTLTFLVKDYDRFRIDDFEGQVVFKMSDILTELPRSDKAFIEKTFPLQGKKPNQNVTGTMTLLLLITATERKVLPKHFGQKLRISMNISEHDNKRHITEGAIEALIKVGCTTEGLFRIPGSKEIIYKLKQSIDEGIDVDYENEDPYDIAGLLKLYLSELPEPLFPNDLFNKASSIDLSNQDVALKKFKKIIKSIPSHNNKVWVQLIGLFKKTDIQCTSHFDDRRIHFDFHSPKYYAVSQNQK
eukprot:TRINITY_DN11896_c0_g1_i1.p1 TRINITY_DN11896_c0_g1~~TRINITY_DN11896_c0_g1_i1.p1  ORF type:complete len:649 (-),score=104.89 TRINITY_DN11896_c0_g1_i1:155-2101(-)